MSLARSLLLAIVATVFALGLAELVVARMGLAPEIASISAGRFRLSANPLIGYEPIPNFEVRGDADYFDEFLGRSNGLGFRDRDHAIQAPDGTFRILVLGDSISMGLKVERAEDVYPARLETRLLADGHDVEVMNFGVSGYNTQQEVATLRDKGLQFSPDLVLLQYSVNDTEQVDGGVITKLRQLEQASPHVGRLQVPPWLARSALYRFARFRVFASVSGNPAAARPAAPRRGDTVAQSLGELALTASEEGFEVLVVVFPFFGRDHPEFGRQYQTTAELSASFGFHHLDLRPAYTACQRASREPVGRDALHPSEYGHACAANAIAAYFVENLVANHLVERPGSGRAPRTRSAR